MRTARLDASLLARKGEALPLRDTYASSFLDPLEIERHQTKRRQHTQHAPERERERDMQQRSGVAPPVVAQEPRSRRRMSLALALDDQLAIRLQIAAALAHKRPIDIVRAALLEHLSNSPSACACLRSGSLQTDKRGCAPNGDSICGATRTSG